MTKQNQRTADNSIAVQSGGDTTITQGITPEQMSVILDALARQIPQFASIAREEAESRIAAFEERLIKRFGEDQSASTVAFTDPDFQYVVHKGQQAYVRSGDPQLADTLIDVIARRSQETERTRLALTLNDAVEKASALTGDEFAELSLSFFYRYAWRGFGTVKKFAEHHRQITQQLVSDISTNLVSYQYLEAHSCAIIEMGSVEIPKIIIESYPGLFNRGLAIDQVDEFLDVETRNVYINSNLLKRCIHDQEKWQCNAVSKQVFRDLIKRAGIDDGQGERFWDFFVEKTKFNRDELVTAINPFFPEFCELEELWNSTPLRHLKLTSVGIALGHANLRRVAPFDADLSIWIQ
jgi:hypothetical protein